MSIIGLIVTLIVLCLLLWAARAILAAFGIGDPIRTVVYVLFVLLVAFWLLSQFGVIGGLGSLNRPLR